MEEEKVLTVNYEKVFYSPAEFIDIDSNDSDHVFGTDGTDKFKSSI